MKEALRPLSASGRLPEEEANIDSAPVQKLDAARWLRSETKLSTRQTSASERVWQPNHHMQCLSPAVAVVTRKASGFALSRRSVLGGLAVSGVSALLPSTLQASPRPTSLGKTEWQSFRSRFVTLEGRVVDTGNGGVSHSEGQGIGLLSAALFGDETEFRDIYNWTRSVLGRPSDALHAWRYRPGVSRPVDDLNNATDGDLLIGLALFIAADRWASGTYRSAAVKIAQDVLRLLVRNVNERRVLLPAETGFDQGPAVILNPSYYVFPAIRRFLQEVPDPAWNAVWEDGLRLLHDARFGPWKLPPDWVSVPRGSGPVLPANKWPARFSFDAVRLPLYMCWGGLVLDPVIDGPMAFWSDHGGQNCPAWIDVRTGELAPYVQTDGMLAIQRYVLSVAYGRPTAGHLPLVANATDYYSGALTMLVHAAEATRCPVNA